MTGRAPRKGKPPPMPRAVLYVRCAECFQTIAKLDTNTQMLAGVVMKARKDHARAAHGWSETPQ